MKTFFIGKNCIEVGNTDSTNSHMARLQAEKPLFEGMVVLAQGQEQGRGQRGTVWESEPGQNLTLSIFLKPGFLGPGEQFRLNKAVSLGVKEFVMAACMPDGGGGHVAPEVRIKWPNDIYIGGKKAAGILIENSVGGSTLQHSIVGIGINVNQEVFSSDLPNPTSLKLVCGKLFDLKDCLEQLCSGIERRYLQLRSSSKELEADYLKSLYRLEEWALYTYQEETIKAKIIGITGIGKLVLETEMGQRRECDFKEVVFSK
jgi:BirA family biotin operon repressor/biotin-[acetyl-CoA-carboxylase] ligase